MKAAVYYETGTPDVFRYEEVPDPVVGPGDILIDVEAVSIEGGDTLNRLGGISRRPHTSSATSAPARWPRWERTSTVSRQATGWSLSGSTGPTPNAEPFPMRLRG